MSRYVSVRTQLRDLSLLRQTLQGMGYVVREGEDARSIPGVRKADLAVQTPVGTVGFAQGADQAIAATGMEEMLRGERCKQLLAQITQQYARGKVMAEAQRAGYRVVEECVEADNTIRLVVRKW